jgi:hypothetical protein
MTKLEDLLNTVDQLESAEEYLVDRVFQVNLTMSQMHELIARCRFNQDLAHALIISYARAVRYQ